MKTPRCKACRETEKLDKELYQCIVCTRYYHPSCHRAPVQPPNSWTCLKCLNRGKHLDKRRHHENASISSFATTFSSSSLLPSRPESSTMAPPEAPYSPESNSTARPGLPCSFPKCTALPLPGKPLCKLHFATMTAQPSRPDPTRTPSLRTADNKPLPSPDPAPGVHPILRRMTARKTAKNTASLEQTFIGLNNEPAASLRGKPVGSSTSPKSGTNRTSVSSSPGSPTKVTTPLRKRPRVLKSPSNLVPDSLPFPPSDGGFMSNGVNGARPTGLSAQREDEPADQVPRNRGSPSDFLLRPKGRVDSVGKDAPQKQAVFSGAILGGPNLNGAKPATPPLDSYGSANNTLFGRQREKHGPSLNAMNGTATHQRTDDNEGSFQWDADEPHPQREWERLMYTGFGVPEGGGRSNKTHTSLNGTKSRHRIDLTAPRPPRTQGSLDDGNITERSVSAPTAAALKSQGSTKASNLPRTGRRQGVDDEQRNPAIAFDEARLDAFIYGQEGSSAPPPGVELQALGPKSRRAAYGHIDPRTHWTRTRSEEWLQAKQREINARGGRKANFGKAAERMKERRLREGSVDFEDTLPDYVRANPQWTKALKKVEITHKQGDWEREKLVEQNERQIRQHEKRLNISRTFGSFLS